MLVCKGCINIKKNFKEWREKYRTDHYVLGRSDCGDCGKTKQYGCYGLKEVE